MAGRGRSGKTRKLNRIQNSDIRRLARRGGIKKISKLVINMIRRILRVFVFSVVRDSLAYARSDRRNLITAIDVINALRWRGDQIDKSIESGGF